MNIVVTYDVNTETKEGRRRLRRVALICKAFGQRVQFSVFECKVNEMQKERLVSSLVNVIEKKTDSLRIYRLHGDRDKSVECYGLNTYVDFEEDTLIF
ncbi:MAG: CRISPR-associated endonuclease Cas2 [Nitrospinae bacterium]|nr:CRISPR-associated endonuclease Cas2 [Nitrospinota bacterium]MBF0634184.1 CRISPR-associated endonuclease Cas2 [Nitrospinota bacterium]